MTEKQTTKTYYDVTQLVHWSGHLTGIPRVMNELAIRFAAEKGREVVFVSWVKELQEFCEVDFIETRKHRGKGINYIKITKMQTDSPADNVAQSSDISLTGVKVLAKKVVKKGLFVAAKVSPRVAQAVESRAQAVWMRDFKRAEFNRGDELIIPWGEWWDENFIDKLVQWHGQRGVKIVQVVHDMGPVVIPQFSGHSTESFPVYCRAILPISSLILAVSQSTKRDIQTWLTDQKLPVPPIKVFRLGDDFKVAKSIAPKDPKFKASGLMGDDFLLCVCTIESRKNHALFYYVYKLAKARGIDLPKIVIVGRRGWKTENMYDYMTEDPEVKDKFVFLHNVSDEELAWFYEHCKFMVFPSFYEGWGIGIAESVGRGVPCICSNTSSMVEIAEGIVEHFSPASSDECLAAIQKWLDPKELAIARQRTKKYKQFSWDDSYRQVATYLKEMPHD